MKELLTAAVFCLLLFLLSVSTEEKAAEKTESDTEEENVCELPYDQGTCKGFLLRFYYNSTTQMCRRFMYGGCGGNNNNFVSLTECLSACYDDGQCALAPERGPCKDRMTRYFYNGETEQCEMFIYSGCGGNGNRFNTKEQCDGACTEKVKGCPVPVDECKLEPMTGPCKGFEPLFYHEAETGKCQLFIYGGCEGNDNKFYSRQECRKKCIEEGDPCEQRADPGKCTGHFPRYFYNQTSTQCEPFIYGGCEGNANRFDTLQACEEIRKVCLEDFQDSSEQEEDDSSEGEDQNSSDGKDKNSP